MRLGVEQGGEWKEKTITTSLTDVTIRLTVNERMKLAIVTFNSRTTASNGTFTLPNDVVPAASISSILRYDGYLNVSSGSTSGNIVNSNSYSVGELVFPIL